MRADGVENRHRWAVFANEGDLVFAGKVGTGFDTAQLLAVRAQLDHLEIPQSPFTRAVELPRLHAHWVRPMLVVPVAFIEWTAHGKLRHPRLIGLSRPLDIGAPET